MSALRHKVCNAVSVAPKGARGGFRGGMVPSMADVVPKRALILTARSVVTTELEEALKRWLDGFLWSLASIL